MATPQAVEQTLQMIRPYLREDGGDEELVRLTDDGIEEVRLTGTCQG
ncbi:MAG: NifU family protein, partial [Bacteroidota bacterium]